MDTEKYLFKNYVKIPGSSYIFQSITKQKLSNIYHSHDFYELFLLLRGTAAHLVNDTEMTMCKGDCVLLTPQDRHRFLTQTEDLELVALSVRREEFEAMARVYGLELPSTGFFTCIERFNDIKSQSARCFHGIRDNENKLLLSMLLSIYAAALESQRPELPSALGRAIAMMGTDEHIKDGIPALMQLTNYSYPHLYRLIRQHYGITPHQLTLRLKLDAAYSRLVHSDLPVEQIAEGVGFRSVSHFIKTFKERFGLSPAKLRSQRKSTCF